MIITIPDFDYHNREYDKTMIDLEKYRSEEHTSELQSH